MTIMTNSETFFNTAVEAIRDRTCDCYTLDDFSSELFLEDADMTKEQGILMLAGIFISRLICNGAEMTQVYDDLESDGAGAREALFRMSQEILADGNMSEEDLLKETVSMAMTYACLENWEQVYNVMDFIVTADKDYFPEFNKERFGKTIGYMYDQYAVEEEYEDA